MSPTMSAALAADPAYCSAVLVGIGGDLTDGYLSCAEVASANAGQISALQSLIRSADPGQPDRELTD